MAKVLVVDESGKVENASRRNPFVLAGIIVDERSVHSIHVKLDTIKMKYGLPFMVEFHAKEIVHGKRAFKNIRDMSLRAGILEDLYKVFIDHVERAVAVFYYGDINDNVEAEIRAYRYLIERAIIAFDKVKTQEELLLIIIDQTHYKHDAKLSRLLFHEIRSGIYTSNWRVTQYVLPHPVFTDSKECKIIQLADLAAYTIRRRMFPRPRVGPMDFTRYYREYIEPKLDRCKNGRVAGCGLKRLV